MRPSFRTFEAALPAFSLVCSFFAIVRLQAGTILWCTRLNRLLVDWFLSCSNDSTALSGDMNNRLVMGSVAGGLSVCKWVLAAFPKRRV